MIYIMVIIKYASFSLETKYGLEIMEKAINGFNVYYQLRQTLYRIRFRTTKEKQKKYIDELKKRSDEIHIHDIPLPNPEGVTQETPTPSNIPKLLTPTESANNQSKDIISNESPGVTPNTKRNK